MSEKRMDLLSLYAGLDIGRPVAGQRVSLYQAISCFFNRPENTLTTLLYPKETGTTYKRQNFNK
jgi:hypothetical protein